jgi:hypothetical protein
MSGPQKDVCVATQAEHVDERAIRDNVVVETTFVINRGSAPDAISLIKHFASHEARFSLYALTCGLNIVNENLQVQRYKNGQFIVLYRLQGAEKTR